MLSLGDGFILPLPLPWPRSGVFGRCQSINFDSKMDTLETLKMELSPARELNLGCFISSKGDQHGKTKVTKNCHFARDIPQKLQSRNCNFCLLHFFENIEN